MSKSKKRKAAQRPKASVYLGGEKIGEVESVSTKPIRIHAGRFSVGVKRTHEDGSPSGHSTAPCDSVTQVHVNDKYELAAQLRELASIVANSDDDFGGGCIVVGRRYSSAFLKKLQG